MTDASSNSPHAPVLLAEVIVALAPAPGDVVIDGSVKGKLERLQNSLAH